MEKNTSSNFRINSICPNCNALVEVRFAIQTDYKEAEPETKPEEKDNDRTDQYGREKGEDTKSADVRPDSGKGKPEPASPSDNKGNSEKGTGTTKTGGKTK